MPLKSPSPLNGIVWDQDKIKAYVEGHLNWSAGFKNLSEPERRDYSANFLEGAITALTAVFGQHTEDLPPQIPPIWARRVILHQSARRTHNINQIHG